MTDTIPRNVPRVGGSFAPPLDAAGLNRYEQLAKSASDERVRDYMGQLIKMLRLFWETPESTQPGTPHPVGMGTIIPLEDAEVKRIWDAVPWREELDVMSKAFDQIDAHTDATLRNAAFHLLWFGRELVLDREPMTNDKL